MITESELAERIRCAGDTMPSPTLSYESFVAEARPQRRWFFLRTTAIAISLGVVATVGVFQIVDTRDSSGRVVHPVTGPALTVGRIGPVFDDFVADVRAGRAVETWGMLTPRAQDELGGLEQWERRLDGVAYLFTWIERTPTEIAVTPLTADTAVVVAAEEEPREGRWLLTTVPVREVSGDVLIDLDVRRIVSIEPEAPIFGAAASCSPEADRCPDLEDARPSIVNGDTLSAVVYPEEKVKTVWFSLGNGGWLSEAELAPTEQGLRASATVEARGIAKETVMLIAIERHDGGIDTYGYRVIFEE